jgi:hypothetical protein
LYTSTFTEITYAVGMMDFFWALVSFYKGFRITSFNGLLIFLGALVVLLCLPPWNVALGTYDFGIWFLDNIFATEQKIIIMASTIGAVLLSIRSIFGLERGYLAEEETAAIPAE